MYNYYKFFSITDFSNKTTKDFILLENNLKERIDGIEELEDLITVETEEELEYLEAKAFLDELEGVEVGTVIEFKYKSGEVIKIKETEIQSKIIDYLETRKDLFYQRINTVPISHLVNGRRVFRKMSKGSKKGFPDILVIKDGKAIGLEVKGPKGKLSKDQEQMKEAFLSNGAEFHLVRNVEEVIEILK